MRVYITPGVVLANRDNINGKTYLVFAEPNATIKTEFDNRKLILNLNGEKIKTDLASFIEAVAHVLDGENEFGMDEIDNHIGQIEENLVEARTTIERLTNKEW